MAESSIPKSEWMWGVFTIRDVVDILGIPRRTVLQYVERGAIQPKIPTEGRGIAARYSLYDLVLLSVAYRLSRFGVSVRHLSSYIEPIRPTPFVAQKVDRTDDVNFQSITRMFESRPYRAFCIDDNGDIAEVYWVETVDAGERYGEQEYDHGHQIEDITKTLEEETMMIVINLHETALQVHKKAQARLGK